MTKQTIKPYELRNISRIEIRGKRGRGHTIGWQVRFRKDISKFFSDKKCGGKEKALEEAKLFRDAYERELKYHPDGHYFYHQSLINKLTPRNTSGFAGVSPYTDKRPGRSDGWRAQWPTVTGRHASKSFATVKYGDKAKQLAIAAYQEGLEGYLNSRTHPLYLPLKAESAKIWRYMDFTKFVSMLTHGGLYFTRIDHMEDVFEGSFSKGNERLRKVVNIGDKSSVVEIGELAKKLRKWVFVNCWHQNNLESAGMWKLYSKTNESVCIQSTYLKLRNSLDGAVNLGYVRYVDYEKDWVPESHPLAPFFYKRLSFEHEKEIRAIISRVDLRDINSIMDSAEPQEKGIWQHVDLNVLIDAVYVAPESPDWFRELVENVAHKYGINKNIIKSTLENEPFY